MSEKKAPKDAKDRVGFVILAFGILLSLLITVIMVCQSIAKNERLSVALEASSHGTMNETDNAATLIVTEKGDLFFNKEKVTMEQLPIKLQTYKSSTKDPNLAIHGDANADNNTVVALIDEARKIGISKVALSTKTK